MCSTRQLFEISKQLRMTEGRIALSCHVIVSFRVNVWWRDEIDWHFGRCWSLDCWASRFDGFRWHFDGGIRFQIAMSWLKACGGAWINSRKVSVSCEEDFPHSNRRVWLRFNDGNSVEVCSLLIAFQVLLRSRFPPGRYSVPRGKRENQLMDFWDYKVARRVLRKVYKVLWKFINVSYRLTS